MNKIRRSDIFRDVEETCNKQEFNNDFYDTKIKRRERFDSKFSKSRARVDEINQKKHDREEREFLV